MDRQAQQSKLSEYQSKLELEQNKERMERATLWTAIGVGALIIAFLCIYLYRRSRHMKALTVAYDKLETAYEQLEQTTAAKERIESELRIAREIQMSMVPHEFPKRSDLDFYASMTPAKEVGGDLYDYLLEDDILYFCLGDVSGKGVPASLFMAQTTRLFRALAKQHLMPASIATRLNNELTEKNDNGMFVTMFIGQLNLNSGHLHFCNAGHNPPVIGGDEKHGSFLEMEPNAPIGLWPGLDYIGEEIESIKGRPLFIYSDGLNEAEDINQKQFGDDHMLDILRHTKFKDARHVVELMEAEVNRHRHGADANDDMTIMCLYKDMKSFINVEDLGPLDKAMAEAFEIKNDRFKYQHLGKNKTLMMIFFNNSLRTRLSTQKAAMNLGMNVIVLDVNAGAWKLETERGVIMDGDKSEHLLEAIPVMGCYCDLIGVRSFAGLTDREYDYAETVLQQFIKYSGRPVFAMETATVHPLQAFADLITIEEHKVVERPKVVLTWAPHCRALPQAVPNSFAQWMNAAPDVDLVITHPEGYELDPKFVGNARVEYDQKKAFEGADFIYAKNWSNPGVTNPADYGKITNKDMSWTVDTEHMSWTNNGKFMHCLPVRRNLIVTDDVIESPNSLVIPEAANREISCSVVIKRMLEAL